MYAIVEIAGQQFKVEEGKKIFVHRLAAENGKKLEFDQVLLIEDGGKVVIGEPVIKDAIVEGKVLEHLKGDKVVVFKKKRKKGYRIRNGHRQYFTQVEIVSIKEKASRKSVKKDEEVQPEAAVAEQAAAEKKSSPRKAASHSAEEGVKKTGAKKGSVEVPAEKKTSTRKSSKESKE
jgi:large subunit ribosomal protein L21